LRPTKPQMLKRDPDCSSPIQCLKMRNRNRNGKGDKTSITKIQTARHCLAY
jgi:hypothetical protein